MGTWCEIPAEFYHEKRVRARKEHRCCETNRIITKGEHYWRCTGKWDGQISSFAQSEAAYHFARYYNMDLFPDAGCVGFGGIREDMSNLCSDDPLFVEWDRVRRGEITRPGR